MSELDPHGTLPRLAPYRTWPGSLVLFTLIVAYVGGLVTWNSNTPPGEPVTPDVRIAVGEGVSYVPAAGWNLDAATIKAGAEKILNRVRIATGDLRRQCVELTAKTRDVKAVLAHLGVER